MQELKSTDLQQVNGGAITAAAVGCALLGVGTGVAIGAVVAIGVCYAVRKLSE
jgi:TRAP-type mannitol/chloroaromatic compound transport system permease large subunit